MERKITDKIKGFRTVDGDGVHLVRVLGNNTADEFNPIIMLDSFDSSNPDEYRRGFPLHPHRGIETISYLVRGKMQHKDSLGFEDTISDLEVQWMTAGSGIMHEERIPETDRLLGVQLWLNLPAKDKMTEPAYRSIKKDAIPEIEFDGGKLRLLAGKYKEHEAFGGNYLPLSYYDIALNENSSITISTEHDNAVVVFTLLSDVVIDGQHIEEKTALKMSDGDSVTISAKNPARFLFISVPKLDEPVVWGGPIVMNTHEELMNAFEELRNGNFLK